MADDLRFTISADNAQALQAVQQLATALQTLVGQLPQVTAASTNAAAATNNMAAGMQRNVTVGAALGAALGTIAGQYLPQVIGGLVSWGKEAILAAAQTETLTGVAQFLGAGVGKSKDEINALIKALNQQGITVQESANLVSMLIRTNIDLEHATRLAAVAQNIAAQSGRISSEVLNGLITAVVKLSPQMLDQYGIIVKNSEAQAAYAKVLGKSADELTGAERQMALLNAIFEKGEAVAGVYGVAMGFASKQMGSLTRFVQDAQNELGSHFLPALRLVVSALTELFRAVRESPELFLALGTAIGAAGVAAAIAAGGGFIAITGGIGALVLAVGGLIGLIPALIAKFKELTGSYENARAAIDAGEDALWGFAAAIARGRELTAEDVEELKSFIAANLTATGETRKLVGVLQTLVTAHEVAVGPTDNHTRALSRWNEEVRKWRLGGEKTPMPRLDTGTLELPDAQIRIRLAAPQAASAAHELAALQAAYNDQVQRGGEYLRAYVAQMDKYGLSAKEVAEKVNEKLGAEVVSEQTVKRLAKETEDATKKSEVHKKAVTELVTKLEEGSKATKTLRDAFAQLTDAQKADINVQQQLLPLFDNVIKARGTLTAEEQKFYEASLKSQMAENAAGAVKLWHLGITKSQIETQQAAGLSEQQIATRYGVTTEALKQYGEFLDATKVKVGELHFEGQEAAQAHHEAEMRWATSTVAMGEEIVKGEQRKVDAKLAGTALIIRQIERQRDADIQAIRLTQDVSEALKNQRIAQAKEAANVAIWQATNQAAHARQQYEAIRDSGVATAAEIQAAWNEWYEAERAEREGWVAQWQQTLGTLAAAFADLAQVSGGTFGGIVRDIAVVINAMNIAVEGVTTFARGLAKINDGAIAQGLASIAAGAMSIAGAFMQATEAGGTFAKTAKGAMVGAQVGAQFGGAFGAAIGAAIGATAGLLRGIFGGPDKQELAGREASDNFTKGLRAGLTAAQKAELLAVLATGAGEKWATQMIAVRDAYLKVGKSVQDAEEFVRRLHEAEKKGPEAVKQVMEEYEAVIEILEQREQDAKEFASEFSSLLQAVAASGTLASRELFDIIEQMERAGQLTAEIQEFRTASADRAARGLNAYLGAWSTATEKQREKEQELARLRAEYAKADGDRKQELLRDITRVTAELADQERAVRAVAVTTQQSADAMSAAIVGSFSQLVKGGASPLDALKELAPSIDALRQQMEAAGFTGTAAFQQLATMARMAADEVAGPALQGVQGLGDALIGLHNSGLLNQEMFVGLTNQITQTYQTLIAQGYDGNAALMAMQPSLQTIWALQQDFGYAVDDATQKLIDQGVEAGIVGDQHRDAQDKMARGIEKLVLLMEAFMRQMGVELPGAANTGASGVGIAMEQSRRNIEQTRLEVENMQLTLADPTGAAAFEEHIWRATTTAVTGLQATERAASSVQTGLLGVASAASQARQEIERVARASGDRYDTFIGPGVDYEGRTFAEWKENFLRENPDDEHRIPEAWAQNIARPPGGGGMSDLLRRWGFPDIAEQFQSGTPNLDYKDFRGGTLAELHGLEKVVPKHRELEDFVNTAMRLRGSTLVLPSAGAKSDPLLDEIRALRRDLAYLHRGPSSITIPVSVGGQELERKVIDISQRAMNDRRLVTRSDAVRPRR